MGDSDQDTMKDREGLKPTISSGHIRQGVREDRRSLTFKVPLTGIIGAREVGKRWQWIFVADYTPYFLSQKTSLAAELHLQVLKITASKDH